MRLTPPLSPCTDLNPGPSGGMNVPIPSNPGQYGGQAPRPQETGTHMGSDLEYDLQNGSDMRR